MGVLGGPFRYGVNGGHQNPNWGNDKQALIAFVNGPIAAHSTAPAGKQQWELDYYLPKNLHEPITLADGSINPENYWATNIYKTVQASSEEPDQCGVTGPRVACWLRSALAVSLAALPRSCASFFCSGARRPRAARSKRLLRSSQNFGSFWGGTSPSR
jgi:hypothetical protein